MRDLFDIATRYLNLTSARASHVKPARCILCEFSHLVLIKLSCLINGCLEHISSICINRNSKMEGIDDETVDALPEKAEKGSKTNLNRYDDNNT